MVLGTVIGKTVAGIVTILGLLAGFYGLDQYFARQADLASTKENLKLEMTIGDNEVERHIELKELEVAGAIDDTRKALREQDQRQKEIYYQQQIEQKMFQQEYYEDRINDKRREGSDTNWERRQLEKSRKDLQRFQEKLDKIK